MSRDVQSIHIMKRVVVDAFILIALGLCILATNIAWTPFKRGFFCNDESLMYPYNSDTVTVPVLRSVGVLLPAFFFLICEYSVLSKEPSTMRCLGVRLPAWVCGLYCVMAAFALGCCFIELAINIAKATIGRPRPHFFDVCRPSIDCNAAEWQNRYVQHDEYQCNGERIDKFADMCKSFLSGHSAFAAYTMVYLALYLQSRMKWSGSRALRHTLQFGAVMLSYFCALSRISDYKHHWSDVLAGYSVGTLFAIIMWVWGTDLVQKQKFLGNSLQSIPQYEISVTAQTVTANRMQMENVK